ncbi:MAG: hypothetical protein ABSE73_28535, partial [Planctomycetota bacterium]
RLATPDADDVPELWYLTHVALSYLYNTYGGARIRFWRRLIEGYRQLKSKASKEITFFIFSPDFFQGMLQSHQVIS